MHWREIDEFISAEEEPELWKKRGLASHYYGYVKDTFRIDSTETLANLCEGYKKGKRTRRLGNTNNNINT